MLTPKVSIATCSYNRPDLLRAACESLRRQTDPDWEHLIYDDASTDLGVKDVLAWAAEDPRVRIYRRQNNIDRPSVLWNYMLDRARGCYLGILDDDNEKLPDFVEVMAGELDRDPSIDIVTCGFVVRADGQADWEHHHNLQTTRDGVERASTCEGGAMLYRREAFERAGYYSEALRTNEDWDWVRRAVAAGLKIKNLPTCHTTYRQHAAQRQNRAEALGHSIDVANLRQRAANAILGVRVTRPPLERLTRSQEDVCRAVDRAIGAIPWVVPGDDLAVVVSPFQLSPEDAARAVTGAPRALAIHMEDPYALSANLDRARAMAAACPELWIATNDWSCVSHYRDIVANRVICCPSLGYDETVAPAPASATRDIDVLVCGYAYPSRRHFVDTLRPILAGRVVFVGDGWDNLPEAVTEGVTAEILPTQNIEATYALHARARAVVCLHRVHGDCADGPAEPQTVNRGFMEGALGARVFLDRTRARHPFEEGDVVWYNSRLDLADKLWDYLNGSFDDSDSERAQRFRMMYSYRTRVTRILNCVRAPRFMAEIP